MIREFASRKHVRSLLVIALLAVAALVAPAHAPVAGNFDAPMLHMDHTAGAPMTDEAMARWVREYYETHPENRPAAATGTPVATFKTYSAQFDLDANPVGTPVDTAYILVGETVAWQRLLGLHTLTSGANSLDPDAGLLFDVPLTSASPTYQYTYNDPGTFPFFCRTHESVNMFGVVIVEGTNDVTPLTGTLGAIGFTNGPMPNPTLGATSFRFALRQPGRVRALVVDASGRRVADLINEDLPSGNFGTRWDGRDQLGNRAAPGVYFLHLMMPGYNAARRVTLTQ